MSDTAVPTGYVLMLGAPTWPGHSLGTMRHELALSHGVPARDLRIHEGPDWGMIATPAISPELCGRLSSPARDRVLRAGLADVSHAAHALVDALREERLPFGCCVGASAGWPHLVLARDPVGRAPLYVAWAGARLWVSDSLRALVAGLCAWLTPDDDVLAVLAALGQPLDRTRTAWRQITRIAPGDVSVVAVPGRGPTRERPGAARVVGRIELDDPALDASLLAPDAASAELMAALRRSVARTVPATGRVALELSGGLDSSLVGLVLRARGDVHAVTVGAATVGAATPAGVLSAGLAAGEQDREQQAQDDGWWGAHAAGQLGLPHSGLTDAGLMELAGRARREAGVLGTGVLGTGRPGGDDAVAAALARWPELGPEPREPLGRSSHLGLLRWVREELGAGVSVGGQGADLLFALTPGEWSRHRTQLGVLRHGLAAAKGAWARAELPAAQLRRRWFGERLARQAMDAVGPWYGLDRSALIEGVVQEGLRLRSATVGERLRAAPFVPWMLESADPGFTGVPVRTEHPFLDPEVIAVTRRIPAWPHFERKALSRWILHEAGLGDVAARAKHTTSPAQGVATWDAWGVPPLGGDGADVVALAGPWCDREALAHALTGWRRYPAVLQGRLPVAVAVLQWEAAWRAVREARSRTTT